MPLENRVEVTTKPFLILWVWAPWTLPCCRSILATHPNLFSLVSYYNLLVASTTVPVLLRIFSTVHNNVDQDLNTTFSLFFEYTCWWHSTFPQTSGPLQTTDLACSEYQLKSLSGPSHGPQLKIRIHHPIIMPWIILSWICCLEWRETNVVLVLAPSQDSQASNSVVFWNRLQLAHRIIVKF